jgi:hypothetical protein
VQAAIAMGCGGAEVQVERWDILTAGVRLAASRICGRAVEVLWRAVVGGRASTAVVVSWGRQGSNALVVGRHVELAAFAVFPGALCLSDRDYQISEIEGQVIRPWPNAKSAQRKSPLAAGAIAASSTSVGWEASIAHMQ